jgi:hypothetical protein
MPQVDEVGGRGGWLAGPDQNEPADDRSLIYAFGVGITEEKVTDSVVMADIVLAGG